MGRERGSIRGDPCAFVLTACIRRSSRQPALWPPDIRRVGRVAPCPRADPAPPAPEPEHRPESGEFLRRSYRNEAGVRQYRLYVPSGYRGEPAPLLVLLHGCKQSPED